MAISSPESYNSNAFLPSKLLISNPFLFAIALASAKVDPTSLHTKSLFLSTSQSTIQYPNSPPCICAPVCILLFFTMAPPIPVPQTINAESSLSLAAPNQHSPKAAQFASFSISTFSPVFSCNTSLKLIP